MPEREFVLRPHIKNRNRAGTRPLQKFLARNRL
jgi:hypothetical protein